MTEECNTCFIIRGHGFRGAFCRECHEKAIEELRRKVKK